MVVFGSKSSSAKTKLFEQPLDKLFSPKAIKQLNEAISASSSRLPLSSSLSAPLTGSTLTWARLSQDNSASKRKRTLARLRRFTIDANNNANLIASISGPPPPATTLDDRSKSKATIILPSTNLTNSTNLARESSSPTNATPLKNRMQREPTNTSPNKIPIHIDNEHCHQVDSAASVCNQIDEDERARLLLNVLPEPIKRLLNELYLRGPETVGIFRKSPNAKHCKELRQKLEAADNQQGSIEQFQVSVIASVFKEWLRSLPDCLLMSRLYPQWIDVAKLIEPLHLDKLQREQQQQQHHHHHHHKACGDNDQSGSRDATTVSSSSSLSPSGCIFKSTNLDSAITNETTTSAGPRSPSEYPLAADDDNQRRIQPGRELSRAISCLVMTTSDSGNSSNSPSSSSEEDSFCQPLSGKIDHKEPLATPTGRCSRPREFKSVLNRDRLRSEDLDYELGHELVPQRPRLTSLELRDRHTECIRIVRQILELLNEANLILLRAIICVLWHIAENSLHNKMSSQNLGVCVGQSLLNDEHQIKRSPMSTSNLYSMRSISNLSSTSPSNGATSALKHFSSSTFAKRHRRARSQCLLASTLSLTNLSHLSTSPSNNSNGSLSAHNTTTTNCNNYLGSSGAQETAKYVPILVAFMIDNAQALFGSDIVKLFGKQQGTIMGRPISKLFDKSNVSAQNDCIKESSIESSTASYHQMEIETCANLTSAGSQEISDNVDDKISLDHLIENVQPLTKTSDQTRSSEQRALPTATQRLCCKPTDLVIRSTANTNNSTSMAKQHRRNPSVIVQIGAIVKSQDYPQAVTSQSDKSSANSGMRESLKEPTEAGTTTSILIVNAPQATKRFDSDQNQPCDKRSTGSDCRGSSDYEVSNSGQQMNLQSVSPSCGGFSIESNHQQRPLSASESMGSSSRASSSTSGVHSESPALSSETDTQCHHKGQTTPHSPSMSATISSPDPSSATPSVCTSPVDMVDGHAACSQGDGPISNSEIKSKRSDICQADRSVEQAKPVSRDRLSRRAHHGVGERPKSLIGLNNSELFELRNCANSLNFDHQLAGSCNQQLPMKLSSQDYVNYSAEQQEQQHRIDHKNQRSRSLQSQTLNRYSSSSGQHVPIDRLPKIPFQYTTSSYGGEAVLYYPSNAHISQQRGQQQPVQREFKVNRVCTRIQSLDRHSQPQQPWIQQHPVPQRSHVMMLRDYYLSLQQQSQQRQQTLMGNQAMRAGSSINRLQRAQHLQMQHSSSQQTSHLNGMHQQHLLSQNELASVQLQEQNKYSNENLLYQRQPASAAVAYQRIQPRLAKIRPNQFNGLYVKRVPSPSHIIADIGTRTTGDRTDESLLVRPLGKSEVGHCGPTNMMAISQSSLSQQSSKMSTSSTEQSADDESDDCSTGEWMESTMV